jgi:hypothetical protein
MMVRNSDEENGRTRASQMKAALTAERLYPSTRIFRHLNTCFNAAKLMLSSDRNGKGVRRWGERLSNSPRCF